MDKQLGKFEIIDGLSGLLVETALLVNTANRCGQDQSLMRQLRSIRKRINNLIKFIQELNKEQ